MTDTADNADLIRIVLADANVLYSRVLRDYLLCAADQEIIAITGKAGPEWIDTVTAGTIAICDRVERELLRGTAANTRRPQIERLLRHTYIWTPVPDDCWERALELQDQLAATSRHSGASR